MSRPGFVIMLVTILLISSLVAVNAQDPEFFTRIAYYIADDEDGVQQVFQMVLDGNTNASRQITRAASNVLTYGVSYDGLAIAYTSDSQLWLQPMHTEEPEAVASIDTRSIFSRPVFSQDSQYIAYPDGGVWLLDLSTRETHQLLQDVPLAEDATNAHEYRIYSPEQFVLGVDGKAAWLTVDAGVWEWNSAGLYNLNTDDLQMIESVLFTDVLPLYGGRVLIYGNNGLDGEPVLRIASDLNALETFDEVLNFSGLIEDVTPFAEQAVEIAPGTVRILGSMVGPAWDFSARFFLDYNLMENRVLAVDTLPLPLSETGAVDTGPLSPDGGLIPVYLNVTWSETGSKAGQMVVLDIVTGAEIVALEGTVSAFQWRP